MVDFANNMSPTTNVYYRGEQVTFSVVFVENNSPLTPKSNDTPTWVIYDSSNTMVTSGIGSPISALGTYAATISIADDAALSTTTNKWKIVWDFVDILGRQFEYTETFDVLEVDIDGEADKEQQVLALADKPIRLTLRLPARPYYLSAQFFASSNPDEVILSIDEVDQFPEVSYNGQYLYQFDIPEGITVADTTYQVLWTVQQTVTSSFHYYTDIVQAVSVKVFSELNRLRMLIDKVQTKHTAIQAYTDSHLYQYWIEGLNLLNGWYPVSNYTLTSLPSNFAIFHLACAAWVALNASYLLEGSLAFNYSGQTVTLDVDKTSPIADELGRLQDFLQQHLTPAKQTLQRRSTVGSIGTEWSKRLIIPNVGGGSGNGVTANMSLNVLLALL